MNSQPRLIRAGIFLSALGFCAALLGGCKKEQKPPAAEIHAITREFLTAMKAAAPADLRSDLSASDQDPASFDFINVDVRAESIPSSRSMIFRLLRTMNGIAVRHRLSLDGPLESRAGMRYAYRRAGVVTHMVLFHEQIGTSSHEVPPLAPGEGARLAIIIDDLGTISVLPNHSRSTEIAQEAHRRGYQVMLHLPMEAMGDERPEAQELRPGMSVGQVSTLVDALLQAVPDAAGVNNHQGSQSTADVTLMDELMPVLREHNLFYVDSRTTAATVAYDTAQRFGVPSGFRNVPFLDDVAEVGAVRKQLQIALHDARKKGDAIAIGHPHTATLQAMRDVLPEAKLQRVRLVFVSELVH